MGEKNSKSRLNMIECPLWSSSQDFPAIMIWVQELSGLFYCPLMKIILTILAILIIFQKKPLDLTLHGATNKKEVLTCQKVYCVWKCNLLPISYFYDLGSSITKISSFVKTKTFKTWDPQQTKDNDTFTVYPVGSGHIQDDSTAIKRAQGLDENENILHTYRILNQSKHTRVYFTFQ